jgi:hypothetical protein
MSSYVEEIDPEDYKDFEYGEVEETEYPSLYDEDDDETVNKRSVSFKKFNVKKIKMTEEVIGKLKFSSISAIQQNNGYEGYLSAYSFIDYIKYKMPASICDIEQIDIYNMDGGAFIDKLFTFRHLIPSNSYYGSINKTNGVAKPSEMLLSFLDEHNSPVYVNIEYSQITVLYVKRMNHPDNNTVLTILGLAEGFSEKKGAKNKIYVVYRSQHGFEKTGFRVKRVNINLNENYNDGFSDIAKEIVTGLNKKNKTNLVILSGCPGSGKTTFIRYLASRLKKNIIFISPDMVSYITDPSFIPFLIKNNDSILIIEDAEPALETRETGRTGAVSNILNLTDGLLSDCLNISIVATFNTESSKIDSALLRKGRLLKNYKFDKLSAEKSTALLKKLGHDVVAKEPMSLSDIYYYGEDNNAPDQREVRPITGFGARR